MDEHKHLFPISKMSQTLGVSRSRYYRWAGRGSSERAKQNTHFKRQIRRIWEASNKVYGSPRIHRQLLAEGQQVTQSMSGKGNCWDNAPAESFFKTLKAELQLDGTFTNYAHARRTLFAFIEVWYNRKRLHSTLDYRTPARMETYLTQQSQAA